MTDHVTLAILAKDKAHTLPLYLDCIGKLAWPKDRIHLYVRTNNNNDATAEILKAWIERVGSEYADVHFDDSNVEAKVQRFGQHEWNSERFSVLAKIRQDSLAWAQARNTHYFVADCDNFLRSDALAELAQTNLPIVAPLLHSKTAYSNYHATIDANGYYLDSDFYYSLLNQKIRGLVEVPVVHCTYFIRHEMLTQLRYSDGSGRHEYVIFSDSARKKGIPQYLDTRRVYGRITFAESSAELAAEPWIAEFGSVRLLEAPPASDLPTATLPAPEVKVKAVETPVSKRDLGAQRICLSMIVKNEAHVIERCLRSVKPCIHAFAICDTGSTDGTQDIIRKFLGDLPGEVIDRPWVDFSTNRNEALELAKKFGDFALVIDADDVLETDAGFAWPQLDAPGYMLEIIDSGDTHYRRVAIPNLAENWKWEGVLHEALGSPRYAETQLLTGMRILRTFNDGARSQQTAQEKYSRDAEVLRKALETDPNNTRYAFYYAQSLRDAGDIPAAIEAYAKRVAMGGWQEEVYFAMQQIAALKERSNAPYEMIVAAYLDACDYRPARAESPCEIARFFRLNKRFALARHFGQIAANLPIPNDVLFVDRPVYEWRARDEWAVSAYWCGDYTESARLCREALADARLPAGERERVQKNLNFALAKL